MTAETQKAPEKSISESEELQSILKTLSVNQLRFVVARQEFPTDGEAAKAVDVQPDTVYRWPKEVKRAVDLMAHDGVITALELRRRALAKAMAVKVAGLGSNDEKIRQAVATELIEWELGKATQRNDNDNKNSGEIIFRVVHDQRDPNSSARSA
jgi:hypothetical protein